MCFVVSKVFLSRAKKPTLKKKLTVATKRGATTSPFSSHHYYYSPSKVTVPYVNTLARKTLPFASEMSMEVVSLPLQGSATTILPICQRRHHRPGGTVSGPVIMGLMDFTLYAAVLSSIGPRPLAVTTNLNVNFLRKPSLKGYLIGAARLLKSGKRLAVGEMSVWSTADERFLKELKKGGFEDTIRLPRLLEEKEQWCGGGGGNRVPRAGMASLDLIAHGTGTYSIPP